MTKFQLGGLLMLFAFDALATNYPCSGMKGGISHCEGRIFICNDGTPSQSKKDCRTYRGEGWESPRGKPPGKSLPQADDSFDDPAPAPDARAKRRR